MIDAETFADLFDEFYPRLYAYIRSRVRTIDIAEDLTAATFERALSRQDTFDPARGAFDAWLFQIASNLVIDHYRARERTPTPEALTTAMHLPAAGPTPEQRMVAEEQQQQLYRLLETLSERDQEIIQLRFYGRLTNRKIAELLDMNEKTVSVVIYRALKKMKRNLEATTAV